MFGTEFHHELIRKYVVLFGTLFNNISISRYEADGITRAQNFKVPIAYGPREKYMGMTKPKPDSKVESVKLPRMAFEITGFEYDPDRQLKRTTRRFDNHSSTLFELAPWKLNFQLNIIVKNNVDGTRIVEQIIPYFAPSYSITAELIENFAPMDLAINLSQVSHEDTYEGSFEDRRLVTWTLDFSMDVFFAQPKTNGKLIKIIDITTYPTIDTRVTHGGTRITIQPGLTANGQPTTDIDETIPYTDIDQFDDFGYVVTVTDT